MSNLDLNHFRGNSKGPLLSRSIILIVLLSAPLAQGKFIGNIHYGGQEPLDFSLYWNQVTPENAGKWASCEQNRDDWSYWGWLDAAYDYANSRNFTFKEHCLVWGSQQPSWICGLSQSEQLAEVEEWIQILGQRYPGIDLLDVVNEPLHSTPCYKDAIGGDGSNGWDWVVWSVEKAGQYVGGTKILNDYGLLNSSTNSSQIVQVANICSAQAIGAEAHGLERVSAGAISSNLNILDDAGLPLYVSEYDVDEPRDSQQLAVYQEQFPVFWEYSAIDGITLWGYIQGQIWQRNAYLLRIGGTRRPVLDWLCNNYLASCSTTTTTTTTTTSGECLPSGTPCSSDDECCSNKCRGGKCRG